MSLIIKILLFFFETHSCLGEQCQLRAKPPKFKFEIGDEFACLSRECISGYPSEIERTGISDLQPRSHTPNTQLVKTNKTT
jgi:hypothetical protein